MPNSAFSSGDGSNPFASDPSSLRGMLQAAYAAIPQAQFDSMPMPSFRREEMQPIDLGAGGAAPGAERSNWLSSLGGLAQQVAPLVGSAMAARPKWTGGDINVTQPANPQASTYQAPGSVQVENIPIKRVAWNPVP